MIYASSDSINLTWVNLITNLRANVPRYKSCTRNRMGLLQLHHHLDNVKCNVCKIQFNLISLSSGDD